MTHHEATAAAVRLLGLRGGVRRRFRHHEIVRLEVDRRVTVYGDGRTWEKAIDEAVKNLALEAAGIATFEPLS